MNTAPQTLIQAQDRFISRVNGCQTGHRNRVYRGAARELRAYLRSIGIHDYPNTGGWPHGPQTQVVRDAADMAKLESACDD